MIDAGCKKAPRLDQVVTEVVGASFGKEYQRDLNTSLSLVLGQWLENIFQQNWESISTNGKAAGRLEIS